MQAQDDAHICRELQSAVLCAVMWTVLRMMTAA